MGDPVLRLFAYAAILAMTGTAPSDLAPIGSLDSGPDTLACIAAPDRPSPGVSRLWPTPKDAATHDTAPRPSSFIAAQLAGRYRLLVVESEGGGAKWLAEWELELVPTPATLDSFWQARPPNTWGGISFPLVGEMRHMRSGYLEAGGRLAPDGWRAPSTPDSIRVGYVPSRDALTVAGAPFDAVDAGTIYTIQAIDQRGGFSGRWTDGSYIIQLVPTPLGTIVEHASGYYCAQRLASDAP